MKINFLDFWGDFDPTNNFFFYFIKNIFPDAQLAPINQCDYIIYSCFGNNHKHVDRRKTKKIFYTGENKRPNFSECDYSFSFDIEDYDGKNVRIPLYFLYIDFFNQGTYTNPKYLLPADWIDSNPYIETEKKKFCAAVFSNPTEQRMNLLKAIKNVDCYGRPFGNHSDGEDIKYRILSEYKFSICPENSKHPGYYTEKLFHAKTSGTIPIYSCGGDPSIDFNTKSFINIDSFTNLEELSEYIDYVNNNDHEYLKIKNEKLFNESIKQMLEKLYDRSSEICFRT
jgi:hypothetical protein